MKAESVERSPGPGNVVTIEIECEYVTEVFTGFGERGVRSEAVAEKATATARRYIGSEAAVGRVPCGSDADSDGDGRRRELYEFAALAACDDEH